MIIVSPADPEGRVWVNALEPLEINCALATKGFVALVITDQEV